MRTEFQFRKVKPQELDDGESYNSVNLFSATEHKVKHG